MGNSIRNRIVQNSKFKKNRIEMKISSLIFGSSAVLGQVIDYEYDLANLNLTGLDVLERGKKKKPGKVDPNNYYSPPVEPTAGPVDPEPETTTEFLGGYPGNDPDDKPNKPGKPDKPDKPNQYGGGSSGAYGDPHFHIVGISESQPDLC